MHYLYKITNKITQKIYIGQSNNKRRWSQHRYFARNPERTGQYIHRAMAKYGIENFEFEILASCVSQEDTNETESILITQYDSRNKEFGYNLTVGGSHGGHSDETKEKLRQATIKQIAEKGHPAAGRIVTEEEKELHRKARLENPMEYTPEIRQKMSESHLGHTDSEETKQIKSQGAKEAWNKRIDYTDIRCSVPDCEIHGKASYKILEGVRYCNKHGLRLLRYGRLDTIR